MSAASRRQAAATASRSPIRLSASAACSRPRASSASGTRNAGRVPLVGLGLPALTAGGGAGAARADWPTYQADNQHTGRAAVDVNPAALTLGWSAPQGYGIPLVVGGTAYAMRNQQG